MCCTIFHLLSKIVGKGIVSLITQLRSPPIENLNMANPPTMKGKEGRGWPLLMGLSQHAMAAWWLPISWHTPAPHAKQSPPINTQYQENIFFDHLCLFSIF